MPAFDIDSQSPSGSFEPQPSDGWSMPVGSIAGIRFFISYSVFVTLAVLAGLVAMVQNREGNGDLPLVALLAVSIWAVGWLVQIIVQLCLHFGGGGRSESITVGLLGVEAPNPLYRTYPWSAIANLMSACFSLTALAVFGAICLGIHMATEAADVTGWSSWLAELATPSLGLDAVENCYLTATWLFWIQAACQAYPLPRNLGRGAIASAVALFSAEASDDFQVKLLRRIMQMVAIITLLIAMATMMADADVFLPRWPIMVLLSIYLWVTASKHDLRDWITSVHLADTDPVASHFGWAESRSQHPPRDPGTTNQPQRPATPWINEMVDSVRMRHKRKLARAALRREHEEADDAARLDHVLRMVSERGTEGLSAADKALLKRVSENLRRNRAASDASPPPPRNRQWDDPDFSDHDNDR
ncbi:MAG: hypothetical protein KDB00_22210 [Planctomycetales bacterium]|nr:hypothetical protein [Planctomycetales bacterium]